MRILLFIALLALLPAVSPLGAQDTNASPVSLPGSKLPTADELLDQANKDVADGLLDSAISEATLSIQLNPKNAAPYELRGSIYVTKKLWDKAERDYTAADKIGPDAAYKYKIAEIHYLQRDYDGARPHYAAIKDDSRLGDVATYKVFLCDLLGSHEEQAKHDLAAMNVKEQPPSFIYGQVAWDIYHSKRKEANALVQAAAKVFPESTCELYLSSLVLAQRFNPGTASFTTKDGVKYQNVHAFLESDGLRVLTSKGWITLPLDKLPDDLSCFTSDDMRDQIAQRRRASSAKTEIQPVSTVSFTTRSGKTYSDARWAIEDNGVAMLGPDGWVVVPFPDLPADISSFPPDMREKLATKVIRTQYDPASTDQHVTFTSKRGKAFDNVQATLTDEGVRVLSNIGWMMVPARDLPDDLSPFPVAWRAQLQDLKRLPDIAHNTEVITFTTRSGKHYDQVRCSLESRGVRVVGPDGLVCVTWKELPDDVSMFPPDWRSRIADAKKAPAKTH